MWCLAERGSEENDPQFCFVPIDIATLTNARLQPHNPEGEYCPLPSKVKRQRWEIFDASGLPGQVIRLPLVFRQIQAFSRCGLYLHLPPNKSGIRPRKIDKARVA